MRGKDTQIEMQSTAFDFVVRPVILRALQLTEGEYVLQLEKASQGDRRDSCLSSSKEYLFHNGEQIRLKLPNPKHASYAWSLYRVDDQTIEYIDSIRFNLNDFYLAYTNEIREYGVEYSKILNDHAGGHHVKQRWREMKADLKNYFFVRENVNDSRKFKLQYSVEIKGELDYICEWPIKIKLTSKGSADSNVSNRGLKVGDKKSLNSQLSVEQPKNVDNIIQVKVNDSIKDVVLQEPLEQSMPAPPISPKFTPFVDNPSQPKQRLGHYLQAESSDMKPMILSDIIQKSNDGSIGMDKSDLKYNSQQNYQNGQQGVVQGGGKLSFQKKRTLNIETQQLDRHVIRRTNTLELLKTPERPGEEQSSPRGVSPDVNQFQNVVQEPTVPKIVTSSQTTEGSIQKGEVSKKGHGFSFKSIAVFLIVLLVVFISAGWLVYPHRQGIHRMIKRSTKTIPKLLNKHMKTIFKGKLKQ